MKVAVAAIVADAAGVLVPVATVVERSVAVPVTDGTSVAVEWGVAVLVTEVTCVAADVTTAKTSPEWETVTEGIARTVGVELGKGVAVAAATGVAVGTT